ncbi:MAG: hypothetical protein PHV28_08955 [Kiritimatiellae bacterium]|nr:hypothetical protein [Kiritimatiellia bacterium]
MMKRKTRSAALAAAAVLLMGAGAFAEPSAPVLVDSDLRGAHWGTAFTNAIDLTWDWGTNAFQARLDIVGMDGTAFTTNFTTSVSNYLWRAFASGVPAAEDVYDLTLTFYTDGNMTVGALTSRLAVVTGAFGATAVNAVSNSPAWTKVKENVLIPYDASFSGTATNALSTQLVIGRRGGAVQTNAFADVAGYYGWKIRRGSWGYGTFDLALTFPGMTNAWTAELIRQTDGSMYSVR